MNTFVKIAAAFLIVACVANAAYCSWRLDAYRSEVASQSTRITELQLELDQCHDADPWRNGTEAIMLSEDEKITEPPFTSGEPKGPVINPFAKEKQVDAPPGT